LSLGLGVQCYVTGAGTMNVPPKSAIPMTDDCGNGERAIWFSYGQRQSENCHCFGAATMLGTFTGNKDCHCRLLQTDISDAAVCNGDAISSGFMTT